MKINCLKKKLILSSFSLLTFTSVLYAEKEAVYISPNNDGVQDILEIPLQIKEKRYVESWTLVITDSNKHIVRTISNKEKRPDKMGVKGFFKALVTAKGNVDVPTSVVWNGFLGEEAEEAGLVPGSVAPDGIYYYYITASDDNGNTGKSKEYQVIVDNTPPSVTIAPLSESEKSFGQGDAIELLIKQSGSKEVKWQAAIKNSSGKVIKNFTWSDGEPTNVSWDGADDNGMIVDDGLYSYEISATDLAGNKSSPAGITNIIYSAEKPDLSIAVRGNKYFSPNGDNIQDTVSFDVKVPLPVSKVNAIVSWAIEIQDLSDKTLYTLSGDASKAVPQTFVFDGTDTNANGKRLSDGQYRAVVKAKYKNGWEPSPAYSPAFVLDTSAVKTSLALSSNVFNATDGLSVSQKDQSADPDYNGLKTWSATIKDKNGTIVKSWDWGNSLPEKVEWNGTDNNGALLPDGQYTYSLDAIKLSGIRGKTVSEPFTLDTSKTQALISASPEAFSPNGDGVQDSVTLKPVANAASGIASYVINIAGPEGKIVRTFEGKALPKTIEWNGLDNEGKLCPDGLYAAKLETVAASGTKAAASTGAITLDTQAPDLEINPLSYTAFSPDKTSSRKTLPVSARTSKESVWKAAVISDANGNTVRTFLWNDSEIPAFEWDGKDDNGNQASNGQYSIKISSTDKAGNSVSKSITGITLDDRPASALVAVSMPGFSPNADGFKDDIAFTIKPTLTEGISSWTFTVTVSDGKNTKAVKTWTSKAADSAGIQPLPNRLVWDGLGDDGKVTEGRLTGELTIDYAKGNKVLAKSPEFVCCITPPVLEAKTSPEYFSPDNDGEADELFINLKKTNSLTNITSWSFVIKDRAGLDFWKTGGKSAITPVITWDGRGNKGDLVISAEDYPYDFTVTDDLGMTSTISGKISIDVLVIRDGNKLKMMVPAIIFRGDNADFAMAGDKDANGNTIKRGITAEQKANNERVLKRIAQILKKFSEYKVVVVGHANRMTDDPREETESNPSLWGPALIPLSKARAEYVRNVLVGYGVSRSRLSVDGKGGTEPMKGVDSKDKNVNWKNRRVEFILEKK